MASIRLEEVTVPGCVDCARFKKFWEGARQEFPDVEFREIDAMSPQGMELVQKHQILASPGILLNGELFSTGGVPKEALLKKLREISSAP